MEAFNCLPTTFKEMLPGWCGPKCIQQLEVCFFLGNCLFLPPSSRSQGLLLNTPHLLQTDLGFACVYREGEGSSGLALLERDTFRLVLVFCY